MTYIRFLFLLLILHAGCSRIAVAGPSQVGGRTSPDGKEEIQIDLPGSQQMKNIGGRDGAGLCVYTSANHAGIWANEVELVDFQKKMHQEQGGGWPEKFDQMMQKYAPDVEYIQYTGNDPSIIKLALKTGRMPCITYGYSPRYGGSGRISHMVNCVHWSDKWVAILDNNFPGENNYEWMTPSEGQFRWQLGGGGWAIVLTHGGPPPVPTNAGYDWQPSRAIGQCPTCPGGQCQPLGPPNAPAANDYQWLECPADSSQVALFLNGRQVGSYSFAWGYYRPYANGRWGARCEPPVPAPANGPRHVPANKCPCCPDCRCNGKCDECKCHRKESNDLKDFGCDYVRIPHDGRYTIKGIGVTEADAKAALGKSKGGPLTDDSAKWHLTIVGTESECSAVLSDLKSNPALAPWKDKLLVQAYRPGSWATQPVRLENGGQPDIVLEAAATDKGRGKVLLRLASYQGPELLASALRQADPNYDPSKDPNGSPPKKPGPNNPSEPIQPIITSWKPDPVHICFGGAALVLALLTFLRKKG